MAERANRDPSAKIEITPARHVRDVAPLAVIEGNIEARIRGDDIALKQFSDVAEAIDLEGFHVARHLHLHGEMRIPSPGDCNERMKKAIKLFAPDSLR